MSRSPEDSEPPNPRRHRPAPDRSAKPKPDGSGPEYSTFRPSPVGSARSGQSSSNKPTGSSAAGAYERHGGFEAPADGPKWWERILFGRVSTGQLAQFCRQFATYLSAGVDFIRALSSLERQFKGTALGPILARIQVAIRRGSTLQEAMAREPQAFGPMFLNMIKVAEAHGGVPETLRMLAHHFEARQRMIRQARSAMIYPVIVLTVASAVVALITIFVIPMFAKVLTDMVGKNSLPLPSRMVIAISQFVQSIGWWLIPLVMVGTPFLLIYLYKTKGGRQIMDRIALAIPVFGSLCRMLDTTRFARTLSVLLDAGVDIGSSIDLTADVMRMSPIRQAVRSSRQEIISGKELSATLERTRQFSPDVIAIMASGEETGNLPESLAHLADDYDEQVSVLIANLGHLVQPLVVLLLGGIVLFIILAVFLPIIQIITSLAGPV
ncbi:MAG: type II secretion system F family protein [Isosphaerales bacterium]